MKIFILYSLLTISMFANINNIPYDENDSVPNINQVVPYIDGAIHDRIIIKLLNNTENSFAPSVTSVSNDNNGVTFWLPRCTW